jgi:DTW domain-containing protein
VIAVTGDGVRASAIVERGVRCSRCQLSQIVCVCAAIVPIETRTRVLIVRHAAETWRSSNTGRLAALALTRAAICEYGGPGGPLDDEVFDADGALLLFPERAPSPPPSPPPRTLVVLDGTWSQARRMRQRIAALRAVPSWTVPAPPAPRVRLRRPRAPGQVATLEAIAEALRLLAGDAVGDALQALYDRFVAATMRTGRRPPRSG